MGWVQGDTLTPALSRSAGEGVGKVLRPARSTDSNASPSSSPSHSQCEPKATKFEPVTQPVRAKSNQVRARHTAGARQKRPNQQAVMERVCDEKSGERRGDNLKMTTQAVACFRRIFAAQIPPSPQRDPAMTDILESPRRNVTQPGQTSSSQAR